MTKKRKGETSYRQTSFGIIPRSKLILLEIEGVKRAWDFILQERKREKISINPESIKKIYSTGFGWIFPDTTGKFRTVNVTVSNIESPKFYLVPQLMEDFCKDIEIRAKHLPSVNSADFLDKITEFLAWMHHNFLWIHPFQDYNGRIARLLINVILINLDLPPIELKVETKKRREKYIKALQNADAGDYKLLEKIIKLAIKETAEELSLME